MPAQTIFMFKDPKSTHRLLWAALISLLVHALLIGQIPLNFPNLAQQRQVLEMRLVDNKPTPPAPKAAEPKKEAVKKEPSKPKKQKPAQNTPPPEVMPEAVNAPPAQPTPEPAPEPITEPAPLPESVASPIEPNNGLPLPNENTQKPFKTIETHFDVYTGTGKAAGASVANAQIVFEQIVLGQSYKIESRTTPNGLASLVLSDLLQISEGTIGSQGLSPQKFLYQYGNKPDKTYVATFNGGSLSMASSKETKIVDAAPGTQDLVSFMYQFMYQPPLESMSLNITNGRKLGHYLYSFEGEEVLETKAGKFNTYHITSSVIEGEDKTELWLATDFQSIPVKIRKTEKNGKVYEMVARTLTVEQSNDPPPNLIIQP